MTKMKDEVNGVPAQMADGREVVDAPEVTNKPSGTQVISARLPAELAEALIAEAGRLDVKPSELLRDAVERFLQPSHYVAAMSVFESWNLRTTTPILRYVTENSNAVVEMQVEALSCRHPHVVEADGSTSFVSTDIAGLLPR